MSSLADDMLAALPVFMATHPRGPMAGDMVAYLAAPPMAILAAARYLDTAGLAIFLRYPGSKARHLVPLSHDLGPSCHVCANCRVVYERPRRSKRLNCSRGCAISWSWKQPGVAEHRKIAIRAQKVTPEGREQVRRCNAARWGRPGEREKLSEQNRQQWADPALRARRSASIQAVNGSAERRAANAALRKALWADPEYRAKAVAAMREARRQPAVRAKLSAAMRRRWADPVGRAKFQAAQKRRTEAARAKTLGRKQSAEHIRKRIESAARNRKDRADV